MGRNLFVLFLFTGQVLCAVDDAFSTTDATRTGNLIVSQQQKNGMWSTLAETDHAVYALNSLGIQIKRSKKICKHLSQPLPADFESLYHTVRASKALNCADIDISSIQPSLQNAISGEGINLKDAFYAWKVILISGTIEDFDCQTTVGLVVELMEDDGSFRDSTDSDDSSLVNAGYAMELVGEIFSKIESLHASSLGVGEEVRELADKVKEITELEPTLKTTLSPIVATATLVRGFNALSLAVEEQLDIDQEYVETTAQFFLDNKYVDNIIDGSFLLSGLSFCTDNVIYVPWSLIVADNLDVRLTDVMNAVMDADAKVELLMIVSSEDEEISLDLELTSGGDGNYKMESGQWNNPEPGFYSLTYKVTPSKDDEEFKEDEVVRSYKVNGKITKTTFEVYTTDSLKSTNDRSLFRATYPDSLSDTVQLDKKFLLVKVKFESNVAPSQVFVQFAKGDRKNVFVAKSGEEDDYYTFKAELESSDFYENIFGSGKYAISLMVGDSLLEDPIVWLVGNFKISVSEEVDAAVQEPKDLFKELPDIKHQFKTPDERPPAIFALIYTGVVLLPLVWLVISVLANIKIRLPSSPTEFLSMLVFQGSLLAFLLLYVMYWIKLTIFHALFGISLLSVLAIFSGNKSLKMLHERVNKGKSKKKNQ